LTPRSHFKSVIVIAFDYNGGAVRNAAESFRRIVMQHKQFSIFDMMDGQDEAPAPVVVNAEPVPVKIQASANYGGGYRVFGVVRSEIALSGWRPTARDVLAMFPLSLSYEMSKGWLDRSCVIDLFACEIDSEGNMLHEKADAHVTIQAGELYDAAESF